MFCMTLSATTTETVDPVACKVYRCTEIRLRSGKGAVGPKGRLWVMVVGSVIC